MNHITSIGLDVHARSITAVSLDSLTGEVRSHRFGYSPSEVASWILQFDSPKAVYESGVTGFHLVRELRELGVDCIVGAVSKMHRLAHLLIRWGYVWNELTEAGRRRGTWTHAHWEWMRGIELPDPAAQESLDYYISQVRHIEAQKRAVEKRIAQYAQRPRWRSRVEALRCMKGIETMTAFALVAEAGVFPRFDSARAFASWLGLVPSEHSSGEHVSRGSITKAGNSHLRKLLVEASWHYARATEERKRSLNDDTVPIPIANHAAQGVRRLVERRRHLEHDLKKRPVVANVATARELACWVWALGCMSEGTLS